MTPTGSPLVIAAAQGRAMPGPGDLTILNLAAADTGNQLSLADYTLDPGVGPPLHRHAREDETFWILEGEVTFVVEDVEHIAGVGTCVFAPRGTAHTFKNRGDRPARMLVIVTPPRNFEEFYAAFLAIIRQPFVPDEAMRQIAALGGRHGLEILGPNPL
ncbi:MAG: cupin domain-containing protein [Phycisphaerae bacterium]